MTLVFGILGSLGGMVVFVTAILAIVRAVMRQVTATEQNTEATKANTAAIGELRLKVSDLDKTVAGQGIRLSQQGDEIRELKTMVRNGRQP